MGTTMAFCRNIEALLTLYLGAITVGGIDLTKPDVKPLSPKVHIPGWM